MAGNIGVILLQTGTPEAPTPRAVRRYLRRFLGDPRVVEAPRALWWLILNGIILPFRSRASAAKYQSIWDEKTGSPLLHYTRRQAESLQAALPRQFVVRYAMKYSPPFIPDVVRGLAREGIDRILAFPMYPQYSATTTGSVVDDVFRALMGLRFMPSIRVVPPYYNHPGYLQAVVARVSESLMQGGEVEQLIFSFHGLPKQYAERGDPYPWHCGATFEALRARVIIPPEQILMAYQSRFGKQEWLQPYTDKTLEDLGRRGTRNVWIAAPGFVADCLETVQELGLEDAYLFKQAGGTELRLIPCLNDHPTWIAAMKTIVEEQTRGW